LTPQELPAVRDPSSDSPSGVAATGHGAAPFFAVSVPKLIVLSICTLGLYELFWFYKNWCLVRERERSHILPSARALFAFFFCYGMFKRVRDFPVQSVTVGTLPAGALTVGWILTNLLWNLPGPSGLIGFLSFVFIIPVQISATRINEAVAPRHDRNERFTTANWVTVVIGGLVFILMVIGSFLPEESVV
jgi:hypothetical protein